MPARPFETIPQYIESLREMDDYDLRREMQRLTPRQMEARREFARRHGAKAKEVFENQDPGLARECFEYDVFTKVRFTEKVVDELIAFASSHYDHACKALSLQGGCLYAMKVEFQMGPDDPARPETRSYRLTSRDLSLLGKATEVVLNGDRPKRPWNMRINELAYDTSAEWAHLHPKP